MSTVSAQKQFDFMNIIKINLKLTALVFSGIMSLKLFNLQSSFYKW